MKKARLIASIFAVVVALIAFGFFVYGVHSAAYISIGLLGLSTGLLFSNSVEDSDVFSWRDLIPQLAIIVATVTSAAAVYSFFGLFTRSEPLRLAASMVMESVYIGLSFLSQKGERFEKKINRISWAAMLTSALMAMVAGYFNTTFKASMAEYGITSDFSGNVVKFVLIVLHGVPFPALAFFMGQVVYHGEEKVDIAALKAELEAAYNEAETAQKMTQKQDQIIQELTAKTKEKERQFHAELSQKAELENRLKEQENNVQKLALLEQETAENLELKAALETAQKTIENLEKSAQKPDPTLAQIGKILASKNVTIHDVILAILTAKKKDGKATATMLGVTPAMVKKAIDFGRKEV